MKRLPLLISIPHGGFYIPPELEGRLALSKRDLFRDIDAYSSEIFDLRDNCEVVVKAKIASTFIDCDHSSQIVYTGRLNGIVKAETCQRLQIYKDAEVPDRELIRSLIKKYYNPYHLQIQNGLDNPRIKLAIDCHSMVSIGPKNSPDSGKERPLICIGDQYGNSCPAQTTRNLAECFRTVFKISKKEVSINEPYSGGYISRHYSKNKFPWIKLLFNRSLFMQLPYFNIVDISIDPARLKELNHLFYQTMIEFFDNYSKSIPVRK